MHYFYILPFKDGRHIKCGISSEDINRIITHNESFDIDIKKVVILNCNRKSLALKIEPIHTLPIKQRVLEKE